MNFELLHSSHGSSQNLPRKKREQMVRCRLLFQLAKYQRNIFQFPILLRNHLVKYPTLYAPFIKEKTFQKGS